MDFLIYQNECFIIEHCHTIAVPGYLIVSPNIPVKSLNDLPKYYQDQLGLSLALATELIEETISPHKIYCAQFGEEGKNLHFHVFPRTEKITDEFLSEFPKQKDSIHGPVLLDWAREKYRGSKELVWSVASPVLINMRKRITSKSSRPLKAAAETNRYTAPQ